jgi:hypothetical protein
MCLPAHAQIHPRNHALTEELHHTRCSHILCKVAVADRPHRPNRWVGCDGSVCCRCGRVRRGVNSGVLAQEKSRAVCRVCGAGRVCGDACSRAVRRELTRLSTCTHCQSIRTNARVHTFTQSRILVPAHTHVTPPPLPHTHTHTHTHTHAHSHTHTHTHTCTHARARARTYAHTQISRTKIAAL